MEQELLQETITETKTKETKRSSSSPWGFGFWLAMLLLLFLFFAVVTAEDKKEVTDKFSDISLSETRVGQVDKPIQRADFAEIPKALPLEVLQKKISMLSIPGCTKQIDKAIQLYNANFVTDAFVRLQIGIEHLVKKKNQCMTGGDMKIPFSKALRNLTNAGIIKENEREQLRDIAEIRNLIVHEAKLELNREQELEYLNHAIVLTDKWAPVLGVTASEFVV